MVDIKDSAEDIETALENLKLQVADREKTPRPEVEKMTNTHEEKNIIDICEEKKTNDIDEKNNVNYVNKENEKDTLVKLETESEDLTTANEAILENSKEVLQEESALNITDAKCQADQNENIEEEKDTIQSSSGRGPIRPNDISTANDSRQDVISSQSESDSDFNTPPEETKVIDQFKVTEKSDELVELPSPLADENTPVSKENAVNLETNPLQETDSLGPETAQVSENIAAENSEKEVPVVKDQGNIDILSIESEDLTVPIKSTEKTEVAEYVPKSEVDKIIPETFESLTNISDPTVIPTLSNDVDPMDDLLSGFEKIKIAATPKPAESSKLFDYNINTGEIEEVKQIVDSISKQRVKIDFSTVSNEESDNVSSTNIEEIKNDVQLPELKDEEQIPETDNLSEKYETLTENKTKIKNCNSSVETADKSSDETSINTSISEATNKSEVAYKTTQEDNANKESDRNTLVDIDTVVVESLGAISEINCNNSESTLESTDKPFEDQITKSAINTNEDTNNEDTFSDKLEHVAKGVEAPCEYAINNECELQDTGVTLLDSDNAVELVIGETLSNDIVDSGIKIIDTELVDQIETPCLDTVEKAHVSDSIELLNPTQEDNPQEEKLEHTSREAQEERAQSEEAQFDSLPDLKHVDINEIKSEEEETETLLNPMLKPQQTEHERKVELNQQKRKNGRNSISNSQLKLDTKTSWNLIPARIQPILAPRIGAFHPVPPSEGTLGPQMPPLVPGSEDSDGTLGAAQKAQQPDAK